MKNRYLRYIPVVSIVLLAIACSKDFLETPPPQIDKQVFFTTADGINNALTGCYDVLGWDDGNIFPFWAGDVFGHDSYKGGEGAGDQPWMEPLIAFQYSDNNEGLVTPYRNYYIGVNRCNTVIDNVKDQSDEVMPEKDRQNVIAQAKFLRGYYYFELVKMFGRVPLVDHVLLPSEYGLEPAEHFN